MALFFFSGTLIYVTVLLTNAVAILSEDRFLARIGWSTTQLPAGYDQNTYGEQAGEGVKTRLIVLVSAVRTLLRAPLIMVNMVLILYELLLG